MITAAAVKDTEGNVWVLPKPCRHCHVLWLIHDLGLKRSTQGFVDSTGKFLDRFEAAALALSSGQLQKLQWPPQLYSEDLW